MESRPTKEASNLSTAGELVVKPATRVPSPTLAMRRPNDESRPEISVRTLRSHSRGGRSSVCVQDPTNQAGNFPLCRESSLDRATRPNNPSSEPEMPPDRPLSTVVGRDPSPPPVEMGNSEISSSFVPTDETSASFHSTADFHNTPQTLSSHIEYTTSTTTAGPEFYTGSHPGTGPANFYTCILNKQFVSEFTREEVTDIPKLHGPNYPDITDLGISTEKLLSNLNVSKASGPDLIPCRLLKGLAAEIAPILAEIFRQSPNDGVIPSIWKNADVAPCSL